MWAATDYFDILGTGFAVQATDPAYAELARTVLEPFLLDGPIGVPANRRYGLVGTDNDQLVAYRDCRRLGSPCDMGGAILRLVAALNRAAIEEYEGFAVHAGAVANGGHAIAFPVDSGGGKSTLTAGCLLAGFDYVSDESLCIEIQSGLVVPYPKPIALSSQSCHLLGLTPDALTVPVSGAEGLFSPKALQAYTSSTPMSLHHVVLPEYGHEEPEIHQVAASEAMAALLRLSFNHYKFGETAFHLASKLASEVIAWRLTYGDPVAAAKLLRSELS